MSIPRWHTRLTTMGMTTNCMLHILGRLRQPGRSLANEPAVSLHGSWLGLSLGPRQPRCRSQAGVPQEEPWWWQEPHPELPSHLLEALLPQPGVCWMWRQHCMWCGNEGLGFTLYYWRRHTHMQRERELYCQWQSPTLQRCSCGNAPLWPQCQKGGNENLWYSGPHPGSQQHTHCLRGLEREKGAVKQTVGIPMLS